MISATRSVDVDLVGGRLRKRMCFCTLLSVPATPVLRMRRTGEPAAVTFFRRSRCE